MTGDRCSDPMPQAGAVGTRELGRQHNSMWGRIANAVVVTLCLASTCANPARAEERDGAEAGYDCLVQPKMVLKLGTQVPGLIAEMLVDRGTVVKRGDVIARLESGVEEAAVVLARTRAENDSTVRSAMARHEFQRRQLDRAQQLQKSQTIAVSRADETLTTARVAETDLNEAVVGLQLAKFELARAEEVLRQRTIRSPIDGVVVERSLGPGEYAYDQSHLVTVSRIDPLNVEVYVPLSQFRRIRPGMLAIVRPEEPVGGEYAATVVVVDQVFDAASGTIGIRLELPNPDYAIPAGLKCKVLFGGNS